MGFVSSLMGIVGFVGIGIPLGLFLGFIMFINFLPREVKDYPTTKPIEEFDTSSLLDLLPELPLWVKNPDYDRVDWLNKYICDMWPYLDKAICAQVKSKTKPIFDEYIGLYPLIKAIYFENLSLGNVSPIVHGIKEYESNQQELILEPAVKWAATPNITLVVKIFFFQIPVQLIDLQIEIEPRIVLKPFVPTFPCFASIFLSLVDKPYMDFGLKIQGGDVMAIPGLYRFVQKMIIKQVARLYLWPQTLEIPILDPSVGAAKKSVGILHVKVVRARKLLKMDLIGSSDPYVVLSLTGETLPSKKTSVKMNNLNPEWHEDFKFIVKDPDSQVLRLDLFDWEKFKQHDKLGMQVIPLKLLTANEPKDFTLDLLNSTNPDDRHNKKPRGQITVEMTLKPFKKEHENHHGLLEMQECSKSLRQPSMDMSLNGAGLLLVMVIGAEDVEGKHRANPYVAVTFRGDRKKTKMMKKTRDPCWNEEFQFMLEEAPLFDKLRVEVLSKRTGFVRCSKRSLGFVEINLEDIVRNGHINKKYHLIDSKNGLIHLDIRWKVI